MYVCEAWNTLKSLEEQLTGIELAIITLRDVLKRSPTGGLTNHAVSHCSSDHLFFTYLWTSLPAFSIRTASSGVGEADLISLSIVVPQSESEGRHNGRVEGDGGGESRPVKPQRPSWSIRGLMESWTSSGWYIGTFVQMSVCSTSAGTNEQIEA